MANPDPEITPAEVAAVRDDAIMATGRCDFPNQVNNVLGFPFIFRGALDVRARSINDEMKLAAVKALAELAREGEQGLPEEVRHAYPGERFEFGPKYIIPKPFDPRVLISGPRAVARAAMEIGRRARAARPRRVPRAARALPRPLARVHARRDQQREGAPKRIVFPEGNEERVLRAVQILRQEEICEPVLLGTDREIRAQAARLGVDLDGIPIVDPRSSDQARLLPQGAGEPAPAQGRHRPRRGAPARPPRLLRRDDGAHGRRARPGRGTHQVVPRVDPPLARGHRSRGGPRAAPRAST